MVLKGYFYYSEKAKQIKESLLGFPIIKRYAELEKNGEIVEYTLFCEKEEGFLIYKHDDVIFLGKGSFHHTEVIE